MDLHAYIARDKQVKEQKEEEQKRFEANKARKDENLKKLDQDIMQVRSEIEKNKDALGHLTTNRDFLLSLCPKEFLDKRKADHEQKLAAIKKKWIAEHKADPTLDHDMIFKPDELVNDDKRMVFSFHG